MINSAKATQFKTTGIFSSSLFKFAGVLAIGSALGALTLKFDYKAPILLLAAYAIPLAISYSEFGVMFYLLFINLNFLAYLGIPYVKLSFIGLFLLWWLHFLGRKYKMPATELWSLLKLMGVSLVILTYLSGGHFTAKLGGGLVYYSNFFFTFVMLSTTKSEEQVKRLRDLIIFWGVFLGGLGLLQFFLPIPMFPGSYSEIGRGGRVAGSTIGDTVFYAVHMQFIVILCFYKLMDKHFNKEKIFPTLLVLLLLTMGWAVSFNRVTIATFVVVVVIYAYMHGQKLKTFIFLLLALAFTFAFAPRYFSHMYTIITSVLNPAGTHLGSRLGLSSAGLQVLKDNPMAILFGMGSGQYINVIKQYLTQWENIHSGGTGAMFPVYIIVELGLVGVGLFSWLIWITLRDLYKAINWFKERGDRSMSFISEGYFMAMIALLATGVTGPPHLYFAFWIPIAMAGVITQFLTGKKNTAGVDNSISIETPVK